MTNLTGQRFDISYKPQKCPSPRREEKHWFLFQSTYIFFNPFSSIFFFLNTLRCGTIQWSMADLLGVIPLKKADSPLSYHVLIPFHLALGFCVQLLPTMLGYLYNLNVYRSCTYCHNFTEFLQLSFWVLETVSLYIDAQFRVWSLIAFVCCILNSCGSLCWLPSTAKEAFFDEGWQMH